LAAELLAQVVLDHVVGGGEVAVDQLMDDRGSHSLAVEAAEVGRDANADNPAPVDQIGLSVAVVVAGLVLEVDRPVAQSHLVCDPPDVAAKRLGVALLHAATAPISSSLAPRSCRISSSVASGLIQSPPEQGAQDSDGFDLLR
jgi:hypothetical protein